MHWRFITLMCALGPSPTEAHAGTLLFLRSDGPLYNRTRATALWLSSGGAPELPKGNVRHCHNHHNLELRRGMRRVWLNPKPKKKEAAFLSLSALMFQVIIRLIDTRGKAGSPISVFQVVFVSPPHGLHLFTLSIRAPAAFTHDL